MDLLKKIIGWYFKLCKQSSLDIRKEERLNPRFWHKDYLVLNFINSSIKNSLKEYNIKNPNVLDLGSFHKPYAELFKSDSYFGVDIQNGPGVDLVADLNSILDTNKKFDLVVCFDTIEHVLSTHSLISTIELNLNTNGYVFISSPFLYTIHDAPYDFYRFTEYFYKHFPNQNLKLMKLGKSTTYPASLIVHTSYFLYRLPIPYFLKYPLYAVVNISALLVDSVFVKIAKIKLQWLKEFINSGPLEYFVVLKKTNNQESYDKSIQ